MTWMLILVGLWVAVGIVAAILIGRMVRTAEVREHTRASGRAVPKAGNDAPPRYGAVSAPQRAFAQG
jgi:hypothetical protein